MDRVKMQIFYKNDEVKEMYKEAGIMTPGSVGFDLCVAEDTQITLDYSKNGSFFVDFGIIVKLPTGYHSEIVQRSSLFKKTGLVLSNGIGIIDNDYCGKDDYLKGLFTFMNLPTMEQCRNSFTTFKLVNDNPEIFLVKGLRVAQLIIRKSIIPEIEEFTPF